MVYVTYGNDNEEPNIVPCLTWEEAEDFCKENNLDINESACEMDW